MKHSLLLLLGASAVFSLQAQITESASDAVRNMGVGWNLGNTLDAHNPSGTNITAPTYWGQQGIDSEECWGQPVTKPELMGMMKRAGFGAIRVPVTWYNHMDAEGNVDPAWMKRVHEVVDYVVSNNLYCILNVHHDTGADSDNRASWLKASESHYKNVQSKYEKLWEQIATEFKDYGKELLFESYNEMLDPLNSWCYASFAAQGQYDASVATSAYSAINQYAQSFVNTVRNTGSNNASRNLIVNTYCASNGSGSWNTHLQDPLKELRVPDDVVSGHIIFQVHAYPAITNDNGTPRPLNTIKSEVDDIVRKLNTHFIANGTPVIIGEWGTNKVDNADLYEYNTMPGFLFQFVDYFVQQTKAAGIGTFFWMGLSDGRLRTVPAFSQPDLAERIAKAYHGQDFVGEYPVPEPSSDIVIHDGDKVIAWGNGFNIGAAEFKSYETNDLEILMEYSIEGADDDIQFFDGYWKDKLNFMVEGKSYFADFNASKVYSSAIGTSHQTRFTFPDADFQLIKTRGLVIHGNNIRVKKVILTKQGTSAIQGIETDQPSAPTPYYNMWGQRIDAPAHGLFLQNGQVKFIRE